MLCYLMKKEDVSAKIKRFMVQVKNALVNWTCVPFTNENLGILSGNCGVHSSNKSLKKSD